MSDWPLRLASPTPILHSIQTLVGQVVTINNSAVGLAAWPAANRALYVPFVVESPMVAVQMAWENGATVAGNVDVGIYDLAGRLLVSKGSTLMTGASVVQAVAITATLLNPGEYYMAMCSSSATATFARITGSSPQGGRAAGQLQQALAGVTLPGLATFATLAAAYVPMLAITTTTVI